ncbi:hypothetical protein F511_41240 [Dorcoceras hygrometricum]|uniref:Uncharacterized protein n=1 Tax=Dorcoceras hygrometricum TaxID=472368 RepID=A0A2Z7CMT9_9LAMI|nr:hypothetical protein F511_41240 [Dorcoceras hygrometricum]
MQIDGGRLNPVMDLIGGSTAAYREEPDFPCEFLVGARRLDACKVAIYEHPMWNSVFSYTDGPSGYGDQYDVFASHQSFAGPSGNVDLYDVFASHQSSAGSSSPSYVYDTMMTSVPSSVVNTVEPSGHVDPFEVFALHQSLAGPSTGQHLTPEQDTLQPL